MPPDPTEDKCCASNNSRRGTFLNPSLLKILGKGLLGCRRLTAHRAKVKQLQTGLR